MADDNAANNEDGFCPNKDAIIYAVLIAFLASAFFYVVELIIKAYLYFQHRAGIYYWSITASAIGIALHDISLTLKFFSDDAPWLLIGLIGSFGWSAMVTGQSLVLWSRLHLVLRNKVILRAVLAMIIVDSICLCIPVTVLFTGYCSPLRDAWEPRFIALEKVQTTVFVVQEIIISSLYVHSCLKTLAPTLEVRQRKVFVQLIAVNIAVICMDIVVLGMQYTDHWEVQAGLKVFVYALKLKLEFFVLNQLIALTNTNSNAVRGGREKDRKLTTIGELNTMGNLGHAGIAKSTNFQQTTANKSPFDTFYDSRTRQGSVPSIPPKSSFEQPARDESKKDESKLQKVHLPALVRRR